MNGHCSFPGIVRVSVNEITLDIFVSTLFHALLTNADEDHYGHFGQLTSLET